MSDRLNLAFGRVRQLRTVMMPIEEPTRDNQINVGVRAISEEIQLPRTRRFTKRSGAVILQDVEASSILI